MRLPLERKKIVTIEKKYEALQKMDGGVMAVSITADLGVEKSTVSDWKKNHN